jgi:protein-tyrosine-phosphatase
MTQRVLFVCSRNSIRSPIAERILRSRATAAGFEVASAGIAGDEIDGFALAVLQEIGLAPVATAPQTLHEIDLSRFDTIIALSPDAAEAARDLAPDPACVELWEMPDPTIVEGNREQRLLAYRDVRDRIAQRLADRFAGPLL